MEQWSYLRIQMLIGKYKKWTIHFDDKSFIVSEVSKFFGLSNLRIFSVVTLINVSTSQQVT